MVFTNINIYEWMDSFRMDFNASLKIGKSQIHCCFVAYFTTNVM